MKFPRSTMPATRRTLIRTALAAGALALLLVGPGRISLDALIFKGKKADKVLVNA